MALRLRLRRDLVCQQAVELVTDYLEDTLSRGDRRRFESHLAGCPHCTEYLAQMRIDLYRRVHATEAGTESATGPDAGPWPEPDPQDPDT
jgi:anti-sigma factor RsiW